MKFVTLYSSDSGVNHDQSSIMSRVQQGAHTLRLILGDQLNPQHSWFSQHDHGVVYVLMEVRQETDYVLHHAQKILAIFAAMRDLARQLREAGHRVRYLAVMMHGAIDFESALRTIRNHQSVIYPTHKSIHVADFFRRIVEHENAGQSP
jgi:deoxyribodipyrimidine photolyase-like uncharacterized protein